MELTERQIEDLIYTSPWLLDERFEIPKILGSRGEYGRQINPVKIGGKFIDLLFRDSRDNRPVIVELKKGVLTRESIGQILEYRSLLITLDEDAKEQWDLEFGKNYLCPKLILIGSSIEDNVRIASNLAGIEVKTFDTKVPEIGFRSFEDIEKRLQEWNLFRNSGKRPLHEREEWINNLLGNINDYLESYPNITSIKKVPVPSKTYTDTGNPFINIPFFIADDYLAGMYEYFDDQLPFDDQFIYFEFSFLNEELDAELKKSIAEEVIAFCVSKNIAYCPQGEDPMPVLKISRENIESPDKLKVLIGILIPEAIEIYEKCYSYKL